MGHAESTPPVGHAAANRNPCPVAVGDVEPVTTISLGDAVGDLKNLAVIEKDPVRTGSMNAKKLQSRILFVQVKRVNPVGGLLVGVQSQSGNDHPCATQIQQPVHFGRRLKNGVLSSGSDYFQPMCGHSDRFPDQVRPLGNQQSPSGIDCGGNSRMNGSRVIGHAVPSSTKRPNVQRPAVSRLGCHPGRTHAAEDPKSENRKMPHLPHKPICRRRFSSGCGFHRLPHLFGLRGSKLPLVRFSLNPCRPSGNAPVFRVVFTEQVHRISSQWNHFQRNDKPTSVFIVGALCSRSALLRQ